MFQPTLASNADITSEEVDLTSLCDNEADMKLVKEILAGVSDLEAYRKDVDKQIASLEREAAPDYLAEVENFNRLAKELDECDATLEKFENLLGEFQNQLCSINSDIRALQDASVRSNQRVDNRLAVYERLTTAVSELQLSDSMIKRIRSGNFDPCDTKLISELNSRIAFHASNKAAASAEARPILAELRDIVSARIYNYLLTTLAVATEGGGSVCPDITTLQNTQRKMLQACQSFQFLFKHAPERATDIRARYVSAASLFYESYCKRYADALVRHAIDSSDTARKSDTLGAPEGRRVGSRLKFSLFTSAERNRSVQAARSVNVFALGDRYRVLARIEKPAMVVPDADSPQRYSFEVLWRSIIRVVLDLALSETPFLKDFFLASDTLTGAVFERATKYLEDLLQKRVSDSYDAIGVAIMLCITEKCNEVALRNHVSFLQSFYRNCLKTLSQRFDVLMDNHIASLHSATPESLSSDALTTAQHYVTRRYAEFVAALLTLVGQGTVSASSAALVDQTDPDKSSPSSAKADQPTASPSKDKNKEWLVNGGQLLGTTYNVVSKKLPALRDEMEGLLQRLSSALPERYQDKHAVFLINNYWLILNIFAQHGLTDGKDEFGEDPLSSQKDKISQLSGTSQDSDTEHFRAQLMAAVQAFRDSQLITVPVFKRLVMFAAESDPKQRENPENLMREFAGSWEQGVQRLEDTLLDYSNNLIMAKRIYDIFTNHIVQQYRVLLDAIHSSAVLTESCAQYIIDEEKLKAGIKSISNTLETMIQESNSQHKS